MKIAILILAHKDQPQLEFLIKQLQHPSFNIYLHLEILLARGDDFFGQLLWSNLAFSRKICLVGSCHSLPHMKDIVHYTQLSLHRGLGVGNY